MSGSLREQRLTDVMEAIAAKQPTPGGGAAAAVLAALGAATARMTLNYSAGKKTLARHAELHRSVQVSLETISRDALNWMDDDAAAYATLNELGKLPADDSKRQREFPRAVEAATRAPLTVLRGAVELLRVLDQLRGATNEQLNSDFAIAVIAAEAAARAAAWNVRINLPLVENAATREELRIATAELLREATALHDSVIGHCEGSAGRDEDAAD